MRKTVWTSPVDIRYAKSGPVHTVSTSAFALEHLTTIWPDGAHGPSFYRAILACGDTPGGAIARDLARSAFIAAARDAAILSDEMDAA